MSLVYSEPARGYASAVALGALIVAGWVVDAATGGGAAHSAAWAGALVIVVGVDLLAVSAARRTRSLELTEDELRVGDDSIDRSSIEAVTRDAPPLARILGRRLGEGLPRGTGALPLLLAGGEHLLVPTQNPGRLAEALRLQPTQEAIRTAGPDDLPVVDEIEQRAEALFRVAGFPPFPDRRRIHEPLVVLVAGNPPVGFARITELDGNAHLDELDVLPGSMRRGLGTRLVEAACDWARGSGYQRITLTTFADVAWNGPFYRKLGFTELRDLGPGLGAERAAEQTAGLDDMAPRIAMVRSLHSPATEPGRPRP